jgi:PEP-CTERM motif
VGGVFFGPGGMGGAATATADTSANSGSSTATATATGGGGGPSFSLGRAGSGGDATALANASTNSGPSTATVTATGGDGGGLVGPSGRGGAADATANASANSGPSTATAAATGGNGGSASYFGGAGAGGDATASATAIAKKGGMAKATANAVGGTGGLPYGSGVAGANGNAIATSTAVTGHGAMAQAQSIAVGSSGEAQSTAQTGAGGSSHFQSVATAPTGSTATTNAIAQAGGSGQSFGNPGQTAYAFTVGVPDKGYVTTLVGGADNVADAILGPRDVVFGSAILGANYAPDGGGKSHTYSASATFDFGYHGDLMLGLIDNQANGFGNRLDFQSMEFYVLNDTAGSMVLDVILGNLSVAESFFRDPVLNLGSYSGPAVDLTFGYNLTAKGPGGFGMDFAFGGAVPEPSTWAMMLLGFAGLAFAGYRSRRTALSVA